MKLDMKKIIWWIIGVICLIAFTLGFFACIGLFFGGLMGFFDCLGWTGGEWLQAMIKAVVAFAIGGFGTWFIFDGWVLD